MKAHVVLKIDAPEALVKALREQTVTFMKGKALQLQQKEVTSELKALYCAQRDEGIKILKAEIPAFDGMEVIEIVWDTKDVLSQEEEVAILAPGG